MKQKEGWNEVSIPLDYYRKRSVSKNGRRVYRERRFFFEIHGALIRNRDREEQTPIGFPWTRAVSARMNEEFLCRGEIVFRFAPTTSAIPRKRNVPLRGGRGSSIDLKRRSKTNPRRISSRNLCSIPFGIWIGRNSPEKYFVLSLYYF